MYYSEIHKKIKHLCSHNVNKIEFSFESVPYDKDTELKESKEAHNIELGYDELIRRGYYPGLPNVIKKFIKDGYILFNKKD